MHILVKECEKQRTRLKLSQIAMTTEIGISYFTYRKLLSGKTKTPQAGTKKLMELALARLSNAR